MFSNEIESRQGRKKVSVASLEAHSLLARKPSVKTLGYCRAEGILKFVFDPVVPNLLDIRDEFGLTNT